MTNTVVWPVLSCSSRSQRRRSRLTFGIESAERLVEQKHPRLDGERASERHALALTAGELGREPLVETRKLHEVEQLEGAALDLLAVRSARPRSDAKTEADILQHGHVTEQSVALEHEPDIPLLHG